jgi:hypothetical protein
MHHDSGRDWNEGHPDHEGEMAVTQLHRLTEMTSMLLNIIGEDDDLPGWIQYKITRAYNDINDAFGYLEAKSHMETSTNMMPPRNEMAITTILPEAALRRKLQNIIRKNAL